MDSSPTRDYARPVITVNLASSIWGLRLVGWDGWRKRLEVMSQGNNTEFVITI